MDLSCDDCGRRTWDEWYMVHDDLWAEATRGEVATRFLCVGCIEKRLGRTLCRDDFKDVPLNDLSSGEWVGWSIRLRMRLMSDSSHKL